MSHKFQHLFHKHFSFSLILSWEVAEHILGKRGAGKDEGKRGLWVGHVLAATEEGTLIEEAGGKHEDAGVAAIVGQQCGSMGCGGLPECFVLGEEPFQNGVSQSILPCYIAKDCYLWTHLCVGDTHTQH